VINNRCLLDAQSYADEDHALAGVLEHAYRSMEDFLAECLALDAS
jgi:hypothetical protein